MHDVIIIGAGPAGLAAALWCDELGLDALVLEQAEQTGGQLHSIYGPIENYPGRRAKNGQEFLEGFSASTTEADFDLWTNTEIASVDLKTKRVVLRSGEELQTISLIIATGVRRRRLGIPGEAEFSGRGIIESASRDRGEFATIESRCQSSPRPTERRLIRAAVCQFLRRVLLLRSTPK